MILFGCAHALFWVWAFFFTGLRAQAQSAAVSSTTTSSRGFQASNSSGFSFFSNGTFAYQGPLNELRPMPMTTGATLEYDGRTVTVTPDDALIQSRMAEPVGLGNTLSSQLSQGTIPATGAPQQVELGYGLVLPGITRVSGSNGITKVEQVDGQSLSIFPSLSPSVFP